VTAVFFPPCPGMHAGRWSPTAYPCEPSAACFHWLLFLCCCSGPIDAYASWSSLFPFPPLTGLFFPPCFFFPTGAGPPLVDHDQCFPRLTKDARIFFLPFFSRCWLLVFSPRRGPGGGAGAAGQFFLVDFHPLRLFWAKRMFLTRTTLFLGFHSPAKVLLLTNLVFPRDRLPVFVSQIPRSAPIDDFLFGSALLAPPPPPLFQLELPCTWFPTSLFGCVVICQCVTFLTFRWDFAAGVCGCRWAGHRA